MSTDANVFDFTKTTGGDAKEVEGGEGKIVAVQSVEEPVEKPVEEKPIGTPIQGAVIVTNTSDTTKKYYIVMGNEAFEYINNAKGELVTDTKLTSDLIATVAALSGQAGGRRRSRRNRRQNGKRQSKKRQQNRQSKNKKQNGGKKRRNSKRNQKK